MIYAWDVETRGFFGKIFKIGVTNGVEVKFFNTIDEFFNFLDNINKKVSEREERAYFYAHNHSFDLTKAVQEVLEKGIDLEIEFGRGKTIISNGKVLQLVFKRWENIYFRDSMRVLSGSLGRITKDFNCDVKKIDLNKEIKGKYKNKEDFFKRVSVDDELLIEYLKNDIMGLHEAINKFIEIVDVEVDKILTIASVAMSIYKKEFKEDFNKLRYNKKGKMVKYSKELRDYMREAYRGGRVEVFKRYGKNLYIYDVNSLYPCVMKNFDYPSGRYKIHTGLDAQSRFIAIKNRRKNLGIVEATVDIPKQDICPLPILISDKLIFPYGRVRFKWCTEELIYAMENFNVKLVKVHKLIEWKNKCKPFTNFIDKFYKLKKENKGNAKGTVGKLILNSLYGKFGMKEEREEYISKEKFEEAKGLFKEEFELTKELFEETKIKRELKILGKTFYVSEEQFWADYILVHIAAHISSYARLELLKKMKELKDKGYTVYYCDTDSIFTDCPPEGFGNVDDKELGFWSLEREIEEAIFIAAKTYSFITKEGKEKTKMKGVFKEYMLKFEAMKKVFESGVLFKHVFSSKRVPTILKQLKNDKKIDFEDVSKTLSMFNDKRKPVSHIDTEAWHIDEMSKLDIKERIKSTITKNGKIKEVSCLKINGKIVEDYNKAIKVLNEIFKNDVCKQSANNL